MKAPQIIVLVIYFLGLLIAANKHGQERTAWNFLETLVSTMIMMSLFIWGGFFK